MKLKSIAIALLAVATMMGAQNAKAARAETYYDSKSHIIGVSGDYNALSSRLGNTKLVPNYPKGNLTLRVPAPEEGKKFSKSQIQSAEFELNQNNAGKYVLQFLMNYDGRRINENLLQQRAIRNVTAADIERAQESLIYK